MSRRLFALHSVSVLRMFGPWPLLALVSWLLIASLQEPVFFRLSAQIQVAWSNVYAVADIGSLALALCAISASREVQGFVMRMSCAVSLFTLSLLLFVVLSAVGLVLDVSLRAPTPWPTLPVAAARHAMVWMPVTFLAPGAAAGSSLLRASLVLFAVVLAQEAIHPVSADATTISMGRLWSFLAALVGSVLLAASREGRDP